VNAASNSSGQGASQAVGDAIQLARCLRDLRGPAEAFSAYEQLRRARRTRITREAEQQNQHKAAGPITQVLRDMTMPMVMKILAKPENQAWKADYRIDRDIKIGSEEISRLSGRWTNASYAPLGRQSRRGFGVGAPVRCRGRRTSS
jgi:FAD-dependent urate hydroxylase